MKLLGFLLLGAVCVAAQPLNQMCLPNMVLAGPASGSVASFPRCRFLTAADIGGVGFSFLGTSRQITVTPSGAVVTFSLPADLLLSGQSANGTDMLSGSRFTDTSPTGNFFNFKSAAGVSLWQVDVTGTLQNGIVPGARVNGPVASASAFAATPTQCGTAQVAAGVQASGNANCVSTQAVAASTYNFAAQTLGAITGGIANTITLSPVPLGVNGTDSLHVLYISGCSGGNQAVTINGGTAVSGASSGTIIFTPANSCTAGATIQSATVGITEAMNVLPSTGGMIVVPASASAYNIYGTTTVNQSHVTIMGSGADMSHDSGAVTAPTTLTWAGASGGTMFKFTSTASQPTTSYGGMRDLTLNCAGSANIGLQLLSTYQTALENMSIVECQVADLDTNVIAGSTSDGGINQNAVKAMHVTNLLASNYITSGGKNGIGVRLGGNTVANTNYVTMVNVRMTQTNAPCMQLNSADSNYFVGVSCGWNGTGTATVGILLDAGGGTGLVQDNTFFGMEPGVKGFVQQNGAVATSVFTSVSDNSSPAPKPTLVVNATSGLQGSMSVTQASNGAGNPLWSIGPALNAAGPFTKTVIFEGSSLSSLTATAGNLMVNNVLTLNANSAISVTTDSAANICAAIGNPQTAQSNAGPGFDWWVRNLSPGANTVTIAAGGGVTITGTATISQNNLTHFKVIPTSCVGGSQAVTIFSLEKGAI